jgi:hypothetical protein
MDNLEAEVHQERSETLDVEFNVELVPFMNTGSTREKEKKYFHTRDLYWHIKTLLNKAITDRVVGHNKLAIAIYSVAK